MLFDDVVDVVVDVVDIVDDIVVSVVIYCTLKTAADHQWFIKLWWSESLSIYVKLNLVEKEVDSSL